MDPTLASVPKISLLLDVYSKHHQTACIYEESSMFGPEPLFQSFTIMQGMLQRERDASPFSYLLETSGSERSRVSFIHDFGGCGVCVVISDRRHAIHEGGSIVSDQLDKVYLPLVVQVLQKVMEIPRSDVGGTLLNQYIRSGMEECSALIMRAELYRLCRSEANLAAATALGLSDVAVVHNHSLQYCMPKENLVTSLVSCHSSAAVQRDRGSRLVLQGGARMNQSTNPVTNPELYHSYAASQRRVGDSGLANSQGLSDGALERESWLAFKRQLDCALERERRRLAFPRLYDGALERERRRASNSGVILKPRTNRETFYSPAAIQRVGGSRLASHGRHNGDLAGVELQGGVRIHQSTNPVTNPELYHSYAASQRKDGGSGLANSQGLSDSAPLEGQVLQGADDNVHRTHPMKWFDSLASAGKAIYSALASLGVSDDALEDLESQGTAIQVSERIYYMLSEHNQSVQQWLRDAGTIGAGFSAVYASPSLATQLPAAVAFISVLTAMWLPRKCRRAKIILTKFGAIASIASVMSAMIKHLSPVGMGIAGALLLIPSGVVVFG